MYFEGSPGVIRYFSMGGRMYDFVITSLSLNDVGFTARSCVI